MARREHEPVGWIQYRLPENPTLRLSYVFVHPEHRDEGLSSSMYQSLLDHAHTLGRLVRRTPPTDYVKARPHITQTFDRLCLEGPTLHLTDHGFLWDSAVSALKIHDYTLLQPILKPLCDQALQWQRDHPDRSFNLSDEDHQLTLRLTCLQTQTV